MRSNLIDLTIYELHRTEKAILVSDSGEEPGVWLPLSAIEVEETGRRSGGLNVVIVTLPERLATERGLV